MNILYQFEHNFLPKWSYGAPDFFNDLINHGEKETLYRAAKNTYDKNGIEFPFKEEGKLLVSNYPGFSEKLRPYEARLYEVEQKTEDLLCIRSRNCLI